MTPQELKNRILQLAIQGKLVANWWSRNGGAGTMAMPQRDDPPTPRLRRTGTIEAILAI